jgi:iron complex outermembrane receptor protein
LSPFAIQGAYGILNLSAGIIDQSDRYDVTIFVDNATDKHYVGGMIDETARWGNKVAITGLWNRDADRYAGVRFHYKF